MNFFNLFCFICFSAAVIGLVLHSCFSVSLTIMAKWRKRKHPRNTQTQAIATGPFIHLIQLPVYNENPDMVASLIDSACQLHCPPNKLFIQLLDDSDRQDLSTDIQDAVDSSRGQHPDLQLVYLHRNNRQNYKAGNLNYGLGAFKKMKPELFANAPDRVIISIFDADFLISADYLTQITPHFSQPTTGIVQGATTFRNSDTNQITRAQKTFQANLHSSELSLRAQADQLSMFRGSAGSLRLSTIIDCGFWQGDTQIEDTDLSVEAQCRGWKVIYDDRIICSSLLPESYLEFKLQQRSWMKGLMEVMRKHIGPLLSSNHLRLEQKVVAIDFFLILSLQALFMMVAHLSFIPAYTFWCTMATSTSLNILFLLVLSLLSLTHIPFFTRQSNPDSQGSIQSTLQSFLLMTSMFITFSHGLLEGLFGVPIHRHRTGKVEKPSATPLASLPPQSIGLLQKINRAEIALSLYSLLFILWAVAQKEYLIFSVYSIPAIIYPLNAVYSFLALRRLKANNDAT